MDDTCKRMKFPRKLRKLYVFAATATAVTLLWLQAELDNYAGTSGNIAEGRHERRVHQLGGYEPSRVTGTLNVDDNLKALAAGPIFNETNGGEIRSVISNRYGFPVIEDGIYWSRELEERMPSGRREIDWQRKMFSVRNATVVQMSDSVRCGDRTSQQNSLVRLSDGTMMCARYKSSCWLYGEMLSFHLSRFLGFNNVPLVILSQLDGRHPNWQNANVQRVMKRRAWDEDGVVSLMEWLDGAGEDVPIPPFLKDGGHQLNLRDTTLLQLSIEELVVLMQYTDMIIFDYLVGHYDRLMFHEFHKGPGFYDLPTHNVLRRHGRLWLIDNETAFFFALKLSPTHRLQTLKKFLTSVCVFRRSTFERLRALHTDLDSAVGLFTKAVSESEPAFSSTRNTFPCRILNNWPLLDIDYGHALRQRIDDVYNHMKHCQSTAL